MQKKPRAIIVDIIDPQTPKLEAEKRLEELESLVNTYGGIVILQVIQKRGVPDYNTFIGKGKVKTLKRIAEEKKANLLIVNNLLRPRQVYTLNEEFRELKVETWDRIDLILQIFSKHAESAEAKLQIELSKIRHMGPRIFGMGEELSRQAGSIGVRAGQGESNIEIMKRHLRRQELKILEKLQHYEKIRKGHRKRRRRKNLRTAALVGYTNAGKSSLLHALTNKETYIADKLFATLNTKVGKLYLQETEKFKDGVFTPGRELLISDTIGFIQDLPPSLIQAFKSTLSETVEADIILHVIDIVDPFIHKKIAVVEDILKQLGLQDREKIYVFNKVDLIDYEYETAVIGENAMKRPAAMVKAGSQALEKLGWASQERKEEAFAADPSLTYHSPSKLAERYSQFAPVFLSADQKINLEQLTTKIIDQLGD